MRLLVVISVLRSCAAAAMPLAGSSIRAPSSPGGCSLKCPYGYEKSIEGEAICRCLNPCLYVVCFGGRTCVIHVPSSCGSRGSCAPRARCTNTKHGQPQSMVLPTHISRRPPVPIQSDAIRRHRPTPATTTTTTGTMRAPLIKLSRKCVIRPQVSYRCKRPRKHWYFNAMTGRCVKFSTCPGTGNIFKRRGRCRRVCKRPYRRMLRKRVRRPFGNRKRKRKCRRKNRGRKCKRRQQRKQRYGGISAVRNATDVTFGLSRQEKHNAAKNWRRRARTRYKIWLTRRVGFNFMAMKGLTKKVDGPIIVTITGDRRVDNSTTRTIKGKTHKERLSGSKLRIQRVGMRCGNVGMRARCLRDPCVGCGDANIVCLRIIFCGKCRARYYDRRTRKQIPACRL